MRTLLLPFCAVIGTIACTPPPAEPATPIEVAVDAKPKPPPVVLTEDPEARPESVEIVPSGAPIPELPPAWASPPLDAKDFGSALKKARGIRDTFARLTPPSTTDVARRGWFAYAVPLVDLASRSYAAAFHAADAPPEGRIDAIAEAADLELAFAMRLDELGIVELPDAWRSDPGLRVTFEEIATGPMKKWRDEARALAKRCVEVTNELQVRSDASRRCARIQSTQPGARAAPKKGDACACAPGDPLCSASLGGWCH